MACPATGAARPALTWTGDTAAALDLAEQAATLAGQCGDRTALAGAYRAKVLVAYLGGRPEEAVALSRIPEAGADAVVDQLGRMAQLAEVAALAALGRFDEAEAICVETIRAAERFGIPWAMPPCHAFRAHLAVAQGLLDDAVTHAETALSLGEDLEFYGYQGQALAVLSQVALFRGDVASARSLIGQAGTYHDGRSAFGQALIQPVQALVLDATGDARAAGQLLVEICSDVRQWQIATLGDPGMLAATVRIAMTEKDSQPPELFRNLAEGFAAASTAATFRGAALYVRGLLDSDAAALRAATEALADSGRPHLHASAAEDLGRLSVIQCGDRRAAVAFLELAVGHYRDMGAVQPNVCADSVSAVPPRRAPAARPEAGNY